MGHHLLARRCTCISYLVRDSTIEEGKREGKSLLREAYLVKCVSPAEAVKTGIFYGFRIKYGMII